MFRRNLGYKILSLVLGILLYLVAFAQNNPRMSSQVYIAPEAIDIENLPANMVVRSGPEGLNVTVRGSLPAIEAYRAAPLKARIDLARVKNGKNRVPLRYRHDSAQLDVVVAPPYTDIVVEKKTQVSFDVDANYNNTPPPGRAYDDPVISPRKVIISGLKTDVDRVNRVVAFLDNGNTNGSLTQTVDLVALTEQEEVVEAIEITPPRVAVTLNLRKAPATKVLVLSVSLKGNPAAEYVFTNYSFDPKAVTVQGEQSLLEDISSLTIPIDISGLRETTTRTVAVPLPKGVSLIDPTQGKVRVRLEIQSFARVATTPTVLPTTTPRNPASVRPTTTPRPSPATQPTPEESARPNPERPANEPRRETSGREETNSE